MMTPSYTQVVAGQKFIITLKLGVTSKSDCKANSEHGFVSAKVCSDSESVSSKGQVGDLQPRVSAVWLKDWYIVVHKFCISTITRNLF